MRDPINRKTPVPGRRVVDRVPVRGEVQPWPANELRHVAGAWRGPVHFRVQGVEYNVRYIGLHEHAGNGAYPLHTHPHAEFHFTFEGTGTMHLPERGMEIICKPGDVVFLPAGMVHATSWRCEDGERWRGFVVNFDLALDMGQIIEGLGEAVDLAFSPFYEWFYIRDQHVVHVDGEDYNTVLPILHEIIQTITSPHYGIGADVVAGSIRVVSLISRYLRRVGLADGSHIAHPVMSKETVLLKARALLEQSEMLDAGCVARIARTVGMSESHFIRAFKQFFGITPKQYGLYILMRRAAALMTRTDVSVKDVAFGLGYRDPSSFTRAFHNYFGVSPTEYQRGERGDT